jgi:hypothetical protein
MGRALTGVGARGAWAAAETRKIATARADFPQN